ncbi:MAG: nucleotidyl transferase AbiEii/AbiGii toxin family protein [Thermoanaerobaculia bacterium]
MDFSSVLAEAKSAFETDGIRFALAGGVAVATYGIQRSTLDLDFVVSSADADAAVVALEQLGFTTIRRSAGFSNHLRTQGTERIDLLFVAEPTASALFARATQQSVFDDTAVAVVHPEHLVAMKLFALQQNPDRQAIDLEDVRALLLKGLVDPAIVSGYLVRYELEDYRRALGLV